MGTDKNIKLHIVTDIKNRVFFDLNNSIMSGLRKLIPLFDRVLVQRLVAETSTKGGILLPEKSVGKMLEGTVIAVGEGARGKDGEIVPLSVSVGDSVLLPEYGGTKLEMDDEEYMLFRESDLLGKFTS